MACAFNEIDGYFALDNFYNVMKELCFSPSSPSTISSTSFNFFDKNPYISSFNVTGTTSTHGDSLFQDYLNQSIQED